MDDAKPKAVHSAFRYQLFAGARDDLDPVVFFLKEPASA